MLAAVDGGDVVQASPPGDMVEAYRAAAAALSDMQRHRVCPTAAAYDLWLAYRANSKPSLTRRIDELIRDGKALTPATIDMLREELHDTPAAESADADHYTDLSDRLQEAALHLIEHAANGRAAIRDYGDVLAHGAVRLGDRPGHEESIRVISMLTAETLKMSERNRELKDQLITTAAKVERLRRQLNDEKQAASTDLLTGLANRRAFSAKVKRALVTVGADPGMTASLLLLDIDHFKRFNDTYGHSTGDLVLRLVGRLLIESIKGRDVAARYGGEEFAILLIGADLDDAAKVARQIGTALANKRMKLANVTEQGQGRVTVSIGVSQLRVGDGLPSAIDRADAALYAAKRAGRNRVLTERDVVPA